MPSIPATCASSSQSGKKIIITTVQKFPFILDEIGDEHRGRKFAIIIDEAHSSQGGRTSAKMNMALSEHGGEEDDEETVEDTINRIMEPEDAAQRQLLRLHRHAEEQDPGDLRRALSGRRTRSSTGPSTATP